MRIREIQLHLKKFTISLFSLDLGNVNVPTNEQFFSPFYVHIQNRCEDEGNIEQRMRNISVWNNIIKVYTEEGLYTNKTVKKKCAHRSSVRFKEVILIWTCVTTQYQVGVEVASNLDPSRSFSFVQLLLLSHPPPLKFVLSIIDCTRLHCKVTSTQLSKLQGGQRHLQRSVFPRFAEALWKVLKFDRTPGTEHGICWSQGLGFTYWRHEPLTVSKWFRK